MMHLSAGGRCCFPLRQIIIVKLQPNDLEYLIQRTDIHMNEMPDKKMLLFALCGPRCSQQISINQN